MVRLQPPSEKDVQSAEGQANHFEEGDPFKEVGVEIAMYRYPRVVAVGSSHITH